MTVPTTAPATPPPAAPPAAGPGGLAGIEQALGGPKKAAAIGAGVLVVGFALYSRSKSSKSTAAANTDNGATTDADSLQDFDWGSLWEQQQQGTNPTPPPTSPGTPPPTAPTPPILGGNPPSAPVKTPAPPKPAGPTLNTKYTVKSGDTLWAIAQKYLGNGTDDMELYDDARNKAVIGSNPNLIKPGEVLYV